MGMMKKPQIQASCSQHTNCILYGPGTETGFRAAPVQCRTITHWDHSISDGRAASLSKPNEEFGGNLQNKRKVDAQSIAEVWDLSQTALMGSCTDWNQARDSSVSKKDPQLAFPSCCLGI